MHAATDYMQDLVTIRDFIRWGASRFNQARLFFGHGTDNAWDEAVFLVLSAINLPPDTDARVLDARLTGDEKQRVAMFLERRINERLPAPYITGEAWFAGLPFHVDERVLIPRSPIAELVEHGFEPWLSDEPGRILDLCAGSGCIGIACALVFPGARVDLADISGDALVVAQDNIDRHELAGRVHAIQSDLFSGLADARYDLIVSNPPYVDAEDFAGMPPEYRHEPELALVSGQDGLDFTRRLLREAPYHLEPHGVLIVEVGNSAGAFDAAFPEFPVTWLEFERGGHGVFVISREQLVAALEQCDI